MTTNDDAIALPCEQCEPTDKITLAEDLARQEKYDEAVDVLYPTVEPLEQLYKDCKDENLAQILARIYDLLADCFIPLIEHYWYKTYDATSEAERVLKRERLHRFLHRLPSIWIQEYVCLQHLLGLE